MLSHKFRQCPPGTISYLVRPGDTFYNIARRNNTTITAIMNANPGVNPNRLFVGQRICLPTQPSFPACSSGRYYSVKAGDTLYLISRRFNLNLRDLINANPGINPERIYIGQVICLPSVLPATKRIPVTVEGVTEYREATLRRSSLGYYIYILNNFTFASEEPGRDVVFSNFDDRFFTRIERLPNTADLEQVYENSLTELRLIGIPFEMKGEEIFDPFFRQAIYFLVASSSAFSKIIIIMCIGGALFRFTMFHPNAEAAEGIIPGFYAMLKTIGIF
ncbi:MAG: LysM peptidoglycan-binding domain-containing protein [Clostridia bacterium]|nr:LysM peptidoglycan-binding domain-containing protein [Clostridia bacterium]